MPNVGADGYPDPDEWNDALKRHRERFAVEVVMRIQKWLPRPALVCEGQARKAVRAHAVAKRKLTAGGFDFVRHSEVVGRPNETGVNGLRVC